MQFLLLILLLNSMMAFYVAYTYIRIKRPLILRTHFLRLPQMLMLVWCMQAAKRLRWRHVDANIPAAYYVLWLRKFRAGIAGQVEEVCDIADAF